MFFVWYLGLIEIALGILLLIGFLTQVVSLLTLLLSLKFILMHKRFAHPLIPSRLTFILIGTIALSLFITGAGAFAIDLQI